MENMLHSELENFIFSKTRELQDLQKAISMGEDVEIGKLVKLQNEINDAESELKKNSNKI